MFFVAASLANKAGNPTAKGGRGVIFETGNTRGAKWPWFCVAFMLRVSMVPSLPRPSDLINLASDGALWLDDPGSRTGSTGSHTGCDWEFEDRALSRIGGETSFDLVIRIVITYPLPRDAKCLCGWSASLELIHKCVCWETLFMHLGGCMFPGTWVHQVREGQPYPGLATPDWVTSTVVLRLRSGFPSQGSRSPESCPHLVMIGFRSLHGWSFAYRPVDPSCTHPLNLFHSCARG